MRVDNIFNRYLFLFVINCFGQEHLHDHVTDSIGSNKIIENDVIPQTYWPLPKQIKPRLGWVRNQILRVSMDPVLTVIISLVSGIFKSSFIPTYQ